jgi:hypothetical protein
MIEAEDGGFSIQTSSSRRAGPQEVPEGPPRSGESAFDAGSDAPTFDVDGLRFGINICFDTNFPEAARLVAERGAASCAQPTTLLPLAKADRFKLGTTPHGRAMPRDGAG